MAPDDDRSQVASSSLEGRSILHLKLNDGVDQGRSDITERYPDRPGEPDCLYYMRTGSCGYGVNCRFNHPHQPGNGLMELLTDRVGQPDCEYYLRTGMCKFGPTCKYHHPKDNIYLRHVSLNVLGFPLRKEEKVCSHYMRYGVCKFGIACKFHHPQPTWSMSRANYSSYPYLPVLIPISQGFLPHSAWPANYFVRDKRSLQINLNEVEETNSALPHRPDQPECRYFMINGTCKFGMECKYHHPFEKMSQPCTPGYGGTMCPNYATYAFGELGSPCKFYHPYPFINPLPLTPPLLSVLSTHSKASNNIVSSVSPFSPAPPPNLSPPVHRTYRADHNAETKQEDSDVNSLKSANAPISSPKLL